MASIEKYDFNTHTYEVHATCVAYFQFKTKDMMSLLTSNLCPRNTNYFLIEACAINVITLAVFRDVRAGHSQASSLK